MEKIPNTDYEHTKNVWKKFEMENLGEYHNLHVKSETLLADLFEGFHNKFIKVYEVGSVFAFIVISTRVIMENLHKKRKQN